VPIGGVFQRWSLRQVGGVPELVKPGKLPPGFRMVWPAGRDLPSEVVGVLGPEHGFDPVIELAVSVLQRLVVHGEPEPRLA
jgi:hypothetical protein